jgi:hypothetical protein
MAQYQGVGATESIWTEEEVAYQIVSPALEGGDAELAQNIDSPAHLDGPYR